jgi:hypothetical protein
MKRHASAGVLAVLSLSAGSVLAAQGAVHVVDAAGGPGSEFTTLSDAIAAAQDGDLLLVRTGDYAERPRIAGKALVVVAERDAQVRVTLGLDVTDTAAGEVVLVRGLTLYMDQFLAVLGGRAAEVQRCNGAVWFEDCAFDARGNLLYGFAGSVLLHAATNVVLTDCRVARPFGAPIAPHVTALEARARSRVHVLASEVSGMVGDAAIRLNASELELTRSSASGEDGDDCFIPTCCEPGGDAVVLENTSFAVLRDSVVQGGEGGDPGCADGEDLLTLGGLASSVAGGSQRLALESPVREGELVAVTLHGSPGDRVWIRLALAPAPGAAPAVMDGELLLSAPIVNHRAGLVPASGSLTLNAPAPALAAGVEGQAFYLQAIVRSAASGRFQASVPSTLVVLDSAL